MKGTARGGYDEPMTTRAIGDEVAVTGPGHVHGAFRPSAARESAKRLNEAADTAEAYDPAVPPPEP